MPFFRLFSTFALNFAIFLFFWNFLAKKPVFRRLCRSGLRNFSKFRPLPKNWPESRQISTRPPFETLYIYEFFEEFSEIAFFPILAKFRQLVPHLLPYIFMFLRFNFQKSKIQPFFAYFFNRPPDWDPIYLQFFRGIFKISKNLLEVSESSSRKAL